MLKKFELINRNIAIKCKHKNYEKAKKSNQKAQTKFEIILRCLLLLGRGRNIQEIIIG